MPIYVECPKCNERFSVTPEESAALALGLDDLTRQERTLFDLLYHSRPVAVTVVKLKRLMYDGIGNQSNIRTHVFHMRPKLKGSGWKIKALAEAYKLVEE